MAMPLLSGRKIKKKSDWFGGVGGINFWRGDIRRFPLRGNGVRMVFGGSGKEVQNIMGFTSRCRFITSQHSIPALRREPHQTHLRPSPMSAIPPRPSRWGIGAGVSFNFWFVRLGLISLH